MFDYIEDPAIRQKATDDFNAQVDTVKVELNTQMKTEIDKQISGLKTNHDKLLDEKKKLQEKFKGITDPEEALAALALVNDNEDFKMIKDGKFEEVIQKRLSTVTQEHETLVTELKSKVENNEMTARKYQSMYSDTIRDLRIKEAAVASGIVPGAMEDILNKARNIFTLSGDEKSVESRDAKGHLRKTADDKILTVELWVDSLKKTSPHYWPQSKGANLFAGGTGEANDLQEQINDAAKRGDSELFRTLRKKQKEMKGQK